MENLNPYFVAPIIASLIAVLISVMNFFFQRKHFHFQAQQEFILPQINDLKEVRKLLDQNYDSYGGTKGVDTISFERGMKDDPIRMGLKVTSGFVSQVQDVYLPAYRENRASFSRDSRERLDKIVKKIDDLRSQSRQILRSVAKETPGDEEEALNELDETGNPMLSNLLGNLCLVYVNFIEEMRKEVDEEILKKSDYMYIKI